VPWTYSLPRMNPEPPLASCQVIVVCAQFKLFLSFSLYDSLVQSLLHSQQGHFEKGCRLVSHSRIFSMLNPVAMVDNPHYIVDPTIYYTKDCHSINKQFFYWLERSSLGLQPQVARSLQTILSEALLVASLPFLSSLVPRTTQTVSTWVIFWNI